MTEVVLYFTTALIGVCWVFAQWHAAQIAFSSTKARFNWTFAAALLFLCILTATLTAGASGRLSDFSTLPPPIVLFFVSIWLVAGYIAFSRFGTAVVHFTPLHFLIGFQVFRLFAELILWSALQDGLAPRALTLEGYNFDILVALTALPVAYRAKRNPQSKIVLIWNWFGLLSLLNIGFIALTSMPTPLRLFHEEPSNLWVTSLPYTLLPGIMVTAAIAGHLILFRRLRL